MTLWQGSEQRTRYLQRGERVESSYLLSPSLLVVCFSNSNCSIFEEGLNRTETDVADSKAHWALRM